MRKLIVAATLVLAAVAVPARAADETPSSAFLAALRAAQKEVPSGILLLGRAESKGTLFGFYFLVKGKVREIEVHARQKTIVKNEIVPSPDPDENVDPAAVEAARNYSGAKLPYARYLEIAMETVQGDPSRIEVALSNGKLVMKVTFGTGDSAQTVVIDMATGKVIK
jgi:uncharacterized membrane protein YkoI